MNRVREASEVRRGLVSAPPDADRELPEMDPGRWETVTRESRVELHFPDGHIEQKMIVGAPPLEISVSIGTQVPQWRTFKVVTLHRQSYLKYYGGVEPMAVYSTEQEAVT